MVDYIQQEQYSSAQQSAQRAFGRDSKHASYIISKLANQTINFLKGPTQSKKLEDAVLFDSPSATATEAERDALMRGVEDTQRLLNSTLSGLFARRSAEKKALGRFNELNFILDSAANAQKAHNARCYNLKEVTAKMDRAREKEAEDFADLNRDSFRAERQRIEDSRTHLLIAHELDFKMREWARLEASLEIYSKDFGNDSDFYQTNVSSKFNFGRNLRRVRMLEILAVLGQRSYFVRRKERPVATNAASDASSEPLSVQDSVAVITASLTSVLLDHNETAANSSVSDAEEPATQMHAMIASMRDSVARARDAAGGVMSAAAAAALVSVDSSRLSPVDESPKNPSPFRVAITRRAVPDDSRPRDTTTLGSSSEGGGVNGRAAGMRALVSTAADNVAAPVVNSKSRVKSVKTVAVPGSNRSTGGPGSTSLSKV